MTKILSILVCISLAVSCKKTDKKESVPAKTVYYRVKMIDKNGHITYSQVKTVVEK
ncbi:MAG: hypothetical protein ABI151_03755 [Chitinophagaceae bacterium]